MSPESLLLVPLLSSLLLGAGVALLVGSAGPVWSLVAQSQIADLTPRLRDLGLDTSRLSYYLGLWGIAMLAAAIAGILFGVIPIAIVVVYLIYVSPRLILNSKVRARQAMLRDQLVSGCITLANATRAGLSLAQGLQSTLEEIRDPLRSELQRIVHEFNSGRPLAEAIQDAKGRLKLDSFTIFANAILVALERGGRITEALETIGASLQETQRLERKIEADTASGRRVVRTLTVFPFGFLALFYFLDPVGTGMLLTTLVGQVVLMGVIALVYFGVRWSNRVVNIEV